MLGLAGRLRHSCAFQCLTRCVEVRVNVTPGRAEVAVAREIRQCVRVENPRPPRQASVSERIGHEQGNLRELAGFYVLPLQRGLL